MLLTVLKAHVNDIAYLMVLFIVHVNGYTGHCQLVINHAVGGWEVLGGFGFGMPRCHMISIGLLQLRRHVDDMHQRRQSLSKLPRRASEQLGAKAVGGVF